MQKGEFRIGRLASQPYLFLLLLFVWFPVHADISVSNPVQSPINPVISGQTPSYTITVDNLSSQMSTDVDIIITIDGEDRTSDFLSTDCTNLEGTFSCGPISMLSSQSYQFDWSTANDAVGDFVIQFNVQCPPFTESDCTNSVSTNPITTTIIAESLSPTFIEKDGVPGGTVSETIAITNSLETSITTVYPGSVVTPNIVSAGESSFDYTLTIPDTAIANEVIEDTITIRDSIDGVFIASIDVTVTVVSDTASVTELTLEAVPGGTATGTFTVSNALPTAITTDSNDSTVTPSDLLAGGGDVVYSMTVPSTAIANQVITDNITITDTTNNIVIATIPVTVTVTGDTVSVTELTLDAVPPGGTATAEFTVSNALPTDSITTDPDVDSSVTQQLCPLEEVMLSIP